MFLLSTKMKTGWSLSFQCAWVQYLTYPVVWALYGWQEKWDHCNLINHDPTNLESLTIHHIMGLMNLPHFDCPS